MFGSCDQYHYVTSRNCCFVTRYDLAAVRTMDCIPYKIPEFGYFSSNRMVEWTKWIYDVLEVSSLLWIMAFYGGVYLLLYCSSRRARLHQHSVVTAMDDTVPLLPLQGMDKQRGFDDRSFRLAWKGIGIRVTLSVMVVMLLYTGYQPVNSKGIGHVQFIDVGQGDCILITTPSGKNILVDGGGTVSFRNPAKVGGIVRTPLKLGLRQLFHYLRSEAFILSMLLL